MQNKEELIYSVIQKIATGPELSKDIDEKTTEEIIRSIFNEKIDDVQSAIFFIALRMKRETIDENIGALNALLRETDTVYVKKKELINIAEPYSGYDRNIPVTSFLPPLLAEMLIPTIIHGVDKVGPKFGITHQNIYKYLNINIDMSASQAKKRIENDAKSWAYIDQKKCCKNLYKLIPLRNKIIKRTVLNTVETLISPIKAEKNHIVLGFVHKPYLEVYRILAQKAGFDSSLIIKGVEGGITASLRQQASIFSYFKKIPEKKLEIHPKQIGINRDLRAIAIPKNINIHKNRDELIRYIVDLGKDALSGNKGMFYDSLLYNASLILWHLNKFNDINEAADFTKTILDSGNAINRI